MHEDFEELVEACKVRESHFLLRKGSENMSYRWISMSKF